MKTKKYLVVFTSRTTRTKIVIRYGYAELDSEDPVKPSNYKALTDVQEETFKNFNEVVRFVDQLRIEHNNVLTSIPSNLHLQFSPDHY